MPDPIELRLHNNSRLMFSWLRNGGLDISIWRPGYLKDGHGYVLQGSTILDEAEAADFLQQLLGETRPAA